MAFRNYRDAADAFNDGRYWHSFIHKTTTPTISTGRWGDMAMGAGTPVYQPYVGNQWEATAISGQKNQGINTGPTPPAGMDKYLAKLALATPSTTGLPYTAWLCDYLLYYPLIDGDSTDEQIMDNTVTLPRYTDGVGVQAFLVAMSPVVEDCDVVIKFVDTNDAERTVTQRIWQSGNLANLLNLDRTGTTANLNSCPFIRIGDAKGIKRINSITHLAGVGGLYTVVLVKPITTMLLREGRTMTEHCYLTQRMSLPEIQPGAYLNMLLYVGAASNPGVIRGQLDFIWG